LTLGPRLENLVVSVSIYAAQVLMRTLPSHLSDPDEFDCYPVKLIFWDFPPSL